MIMWVTYNRLIATCVYCNDCYMHPLNIHSSAWVVNPNARTPNFMNPINPNARPFVPGAPVHHVQTEAPEFWPGKERHWVLDSRLLSSKAATFWRGVYRHRGGRYTRESSFGGSQWGKTEKESEPRPRDVQARASGEGPQRNKPGGTNPVGQNTKQSAKQQRKAALQELLWLDKTQRLLQKLRAQGPPVS